MQKKAIIIGATGLVGAKLVDQLIALYQTVIVIARTPPKKMTPTTHFYQLANFDHLSELFASLNVDGNTDAFSCLGTTKKQAGSRDAFWAIDYDINLTFAKLCQQKGVAQFFLLSSMGADKDSRFFYNKVKGELEYAIKQLGFECVYVFRPALLLGKHKGRPLEAVSQGLFKMVSPLVPQNLAVRPISAGRVAAAMAITAHQSHQRLSKHRHQNQNGNGGNGNNTQTNGSITVINNQQMLMMTHLN